MPSDVAPPPPFLTPGEALGDVYIKVRRRMSPKVKELLASAELADGLALLRKLREDPKLMHSAEARLRPVLLGVLKADPGPLLLGLNDERLSEPWRLLVDGWDVWSSDEPKGVSLFWEGEAGAGEAGPGEAEGEPPVEVLQELVFAEGDVTLSTQLGDQRDRVVYDGQAFYRPKL